MPNYYRLFFGYPYMFFCKKIHIYYTTTQQEMIKFDILMIKLTVHAWYFFPG